MQEVAHNLISKVDQQQGKRAQMAQQTYLTEFEKSVLKRTELEKRQRKREEERKVDLEYTKQERFEKEQAIKRRQEEKQLQQVKTSQKINNQAQAYFKRHQTPVKLERLDTNYTGSKGTNARRQMLHQMNLQRRKNQQRQYKALLIDKLEKKEIRSSLIVQKREAAQEISQRMHINL